MVTVKNRLNQMLVVNVPQEDALYFLNKEKKVLTPDQYNAPEMQRYIEMGDILVLKMD